MNERLKMRVETVEELAESIARFVGKNAELDILNVFSPSDITWNVEATQLMDYLHEITGINKEKLGSWVEEATHLRS